MFRLTTEEFGEILADVVRKKTHDAHQTWHPEDIAIQHSEVAEIVGYTLAALIEQGYLTNEE